MIHGVSSQAFSFLSPAVFKAFSDYSRTWSRQRQVSGYVIFFFYFFTRNFLFNVFSVGFWRFHGGFSFVRFFYLYLSARCWGTTITWAATWEAAGRKVSRTTPLVAQSVASAGEGSRRYGRGREGLLAKYPLAFAKSVERKGPLVNTLWCARHCVRVWLPGRGGRGGSEGRKKALVQSGRGRSCAWNHTSLFCQTPLLLLDIYFDLAVATPAPPPLLLLLLLLLLWLQVFCE